MMINAFRSDKKPCQIAKKIETRNGTTGRVELTYGTPYLTKGIFYESSNVQNYVSDKLKANVDGIFILDYLVVKGFDLSDNDRVYFFGRTFAVVHCEAPMYQSEFFVVYVKEIA
jgi:hypothetical protein